MRFSVTSAERPKSIARAIQRALKTSAQARSYSQCLELIARLYGYRSWRELEAGIGTAPASPPDHACSPDERAERRAFQEAALREAGFAFDEARALLDAVGPTSGKAETSWTEAAAQNVSDSVANVHTRLVNALHWLGQNAHNVRLITPPKDTAGEFILAWEIPKDFPYQPHAIKAGCFYIRLRTGVCGEDALGEKQKIVPCGISAGRFVGKIPSGFMDPSDLRPPVGGDLQSLSKILARMGYTVPSKDHGIKRLSAAMNRFIEAFDCEVLHALRSKKSFCIEDYMALLKLKGESPSLFRMISDAPVLASLITRSSRPHWPIGLDIEIIDSDDPKLALASALADDVCSINALTKAIHRCQHWVPRTIRCDGMTEQALRLLALCSEANVPTRLNEIESLLDLGYMLQHDPEKDSHRIYGIADASDRESWTDLMMRLDPNPPVSWKWDVRQTDRDQEMLQSIS